jgi:tetratricopeptide (TPR) repeat protein
LKPARRCAPARKEQACAALALMVLLAACSPAPAQLAATPALDAAAASRAEAEQLLALGERYARAGDSLRAEQYLVAALDAGIEPRAVLPMLLRVCVDARRYRVALEHAEEALAADPENSHLRFLTGTLLAMTGDVPGARVHLTRAARELLHSAEVQFSVAVFARDQAQDPAAADGYFRRYLELEPHGVHAGEARNCLLTEVP